MIPQPSLHTFVAYVEDQPGVLNRISSLFRRRNFNIISLNVGRAHQPGVSRMTFVVEADDAHARRIEANLYKLVNVLSVEDITDKPNIVRDLALIKMKAPPERRGEIFQLCQVFRARPVDVGPDTLVVEITGTQDKIQGLVTVLEPFGILELVQSGTVAMTRGAIGDAAKAIRDPQVARGIAAA
ncbi:MAG TPA: acetolactate synthase small subunit [Polyangiaceae bacterium]